MWCQIQRNENTTNKGMSRIQFLEDASRPATYLSQIFGRMNGDMNKIITKNTLAAFQVGIIGFKFLYPFTLLNL